MFLLPLLLLGSGTPVFAEIDGALKKEQVPTPPVLVTDLRPVEFCDWTWQSTPGQTGTEASILGNYLGIGIGGGWQLGVVPAAYALVVDGKHEQTQVQQYVIKSPAFGGTWWQSGFAYSRLSFSRQTKETGYQQDLSSTLATLSWILQLKLTEQQQILLTSGLVGNRYEIEVPSLGKQTQSLTATVNELEFIHRLTASWSYHLTGSYSPVLTNLGSFENGQNQELWGTGAAATYQSNFWLSRISLGFHYVEQGKSFVLFDFGF
ncbi:MAG: hypothetical protein HRU19_20610 [Pseudobacteriovorax sp.]|nr:hypothetical protein [Pseudobacteriovorax sp.]